MEDRNVRRGDIYHADLDPVFGSEQGGYRPVLVIQNNIGNKYSPTVIVAAITIAILLISANSRCVEPPFAIIRTYCF